ncbi:MAG: hypothetical protein ACLP1X_06180 [Polyangiaceae bacterium]
MGFPQTQGIWSISQAYVAQTVTPGELATDLAAIEATWDPSRAMVSARVLDCLGTPAPNVRVALDTPSQDSQTTVFYYNETRATSTSATSDAATSPNGLVSFFDVPAPDAGSVNILLTATPLGLGKVSSREGANVQAGVLSAVEMTPTP